LAVELTCSGTSGRVQILSGSGGSFSFQFIDMVNTPLVLPMLLQLALKNRLNFSALERDLVFNCL